jgi:hypothetical protein
MLTALQQCLILGFNDMPTLWSEPTGPYSQNTRRDISPNSNIGSTAGTASKQ